MLPLPALCAGGDIQGEGVQHPGVDAGERIGVLLSVYGKRALVLEGAVLKQEGAQIVVIALHAPDIGGKPGSFKEIALAGCVGDIGEQPELIAAADLQKALEHGLVPGAVDAADILFRLISGKGMEAVLPGLRLFSGGKAVSGHLLLIVVAEAQPLAAGQIFTGAGKAVQGDMIPAHRQTGIRALHSGF